MRGQDRLGQSRVVRLDRDEPQRLQVGHDLTAVGGRPEGDQRRVGPDGVAQPGRGAQQVDVPRRERQRRLRPGSRGVPADRCGQLEDRSDRRCTDRRRDLRRLRHRCDGSAPRSLGSPGRGCADPSAAAAAQVCLGQLGRWWRLRDSSAHRTGLQLDPTAGRCAGTTAAASRPPTPASPATSGSTTLVCAGRTGHDRWAGAGAGQGTVFSAAGGVRVAGSDGSGEAPPRLPGRGRGRASASPPGRGGPPGDRLVTRCSELRSSAGLPDRSRRCARPSRRGRGVLRRVRGTCREQSSRSVPPAARPDRRAGSGWPRTPPATGRGRTTADAAIEDRRVTRLHHYRPGSRSTARRRESADASPAQVDRDHRSADPGSRRRSSASRAPRRRTARPSTRDRHPAPPCTGCRPPAAPPPAHAGPVRR